MKSEQKKKEVSKREYGGHRARLNLRAFEMERNEIGREPSEEVKVNIINCFTSERDREGERERTS